MTRHRKSAFFILVFCLVCTAEALGQGHTIRGKVRNAAGVNMSQTTVSLESGTGGLINQTVTNNEGDFAFSGLEETSYLIVISAPDYNPTTERVDFVRNVTSNDPGETRTVEITMVRKGEPSTKRPEVSFVQDIPKAARDSFEQGLKLSRGGNTTEAVVALQQAITIFPDYFNARFLLAKELIKQDKLGDAIVQLEEARRVNPKDDRVFYAFGTIMVRQQKYVVAARVFAEAANMNPREIQYLVMQGTALIDQGATIDPTKSSSAVSERTYVFSEAEKVLSKAYQLSGNKLSTVHLQLARLYEKQGDRAKAANELEQYLKQSPDDKKSAEIREAIKKLRTSHP